MATEIKSDREWHARRNISLGASDSAAAVGCNPWKSNVQLWMEKTGRAIPEDISNNSGVKFGVACEPPIREIMKATFAENGLTLSYGGKWDVVEREDRPWYMATLDGRLVDSEGLQGVWECKTSYITSKASSESWKGRIPDYYFCQVLHQMNASGFSYAILTAYLRESYEAIGQVATMRQYEFRMEDYREQAEWLLAKEAEFWKYVESDKEPPLLLPAI